MPERLHRDHGRESDQARGGRRTGVARFHDRDHDYAVVAAEAAAAEAGESAWSPAVKLLMCCALGREMWTALMPAGVDRGRVWWWRLKLMKTPLENWRLPEAECSGRPSRSSYRKL